MLSAREPEPPAQEHAITADQNPARLKSNHDQLSDVPVPANSNRSTSCCKNPHLITRDYEIVCKNCGIVKKNSTLLINQEYRHSNSSTKLGTFLDKKYPMSKKQRRIIYGKDEYLTNFHKSLSPLNLSKMIREHAESLFISITKIKKESKLRIPTYGEIAFTSILWSCRLHDHPLDENALIKAISAFPHKTFRINRAKMLVSHMMKKNGTILPKSKKNPLRKIRSISDQMKAIRLSKKFGMDAAVSLTAHQWDD